MEIDAYSGTGGDLVMDFSGCNKGFSSRTRGQNLTLMHQCQFVADWLKRALAENASEPCYDPEVIYNIHQVEQFEEVTRNIPVSTYRIGSGDNHYYFIKRTTFNGNTQCFNFNLKYAPAIVTKIVEAYLEVGQDLEQLKEVCVTLSEIIRLTKTPSSEIEPAVGDLPIKTWSKLCGEHNFFNLQHRTKEQGNLYASFNLKFAPELIRRIVESYIATGHRLETIKALIYLKVMRMINSKLVDNGKW